jgi:hypothetical protein
MIYFNIDLNEYSSKKSQIIKLLIYGAIVCISFMVISYSVFLQYRPYLENLFLISSIYLALYLYFAWITFNTKLFVKADTSGIEFKFGILKRSKDYIIWDTVKRIRIGPAYITFYKKSGRNKRIQLGWLPYSKVIEIKEKIVGICKAKEIEFEEVDFIRYTHKGK